MPEFGRLEQGPTGTKRRSGRGGGRDAAFVFRPSSVLTATADETEQKGPADAGPFCDVSLC